MTAKPVLVLQGCQAFPRIVENSGSEWSRKILDPIHDLTPLKKSIIFVPFRIADHKIANYKRLSLST